MSFRTQVASDVDRDGLGVELLDEEGRVIAEVFRCDRDKSLVLSTFGNEISVADIERLLARAMERLGPFEDGSTLSDAAGSIARPSSSKFGEPAG